MDTLEADMGADLAEGTPLPHQAVETLAVVVAHTPRLLAGSTAEAVRITEVAGTMAGADIMAPALDSASAFTLTDMPHLMDMPLRPAIPPDSTMQTACGNTIPAALCRTDIKLKFFCCPNDV